jgi:TPR repeat protein
MLLKRLLLCLFLLLPGLLNAAEVDLAGLRAKAEQGDAWSQLNLGAAYDNAISTERNVDEAIKWYRMAAKQGLAEAQFNLAHILVDEDISATAAAEWMAKAAAQGMPDAQYLMGVIYSEGLGVEQDDAKAIEWLNKAVAQGQQDAVQFLQQHYTPVGESE